MMRIRSIDIARWLLLGSTFLACPGIGGQELPTNPTDLSNLSVRNQDILLRDLAPLLKTAGAAGRLYLRSKCGGTSEDILFFPRIAVNSGTKREAGLAGIRDALAENKEAVVAERQPGLIGIWVGGVSNDLLKTRIHTLTLKPMERYNYQDAIAAIINTSEVQAKMRQLRMEVSARLIHYPITSPDPKLPHLPSSLNDLTMDEALDRVAQVFRGLLIYEECKGQEPTGLFSVHMHEM